jgi:hypothetical protein
MVPVSLFMKVESKAKAVERTVPELSLICESVSTLRSTHVSPLAKGSRGSFEPIIKNNRMTVDCEWTLPDQTHIKKAERLDPKPDKLLLGLMHASSRTNIIISLYDKLSEVKLDELPKALTLATNDDLTFRYLGDKPLDSSDFAATFHLWVAGTTSEDEYKHFEKLILVVIPRLGEIGGCDLTKTRVSVHEWKDARSVSHEMFRELSRAGASSASPQASPPSPPSGLSRYHSGENKWMTIIHNASHPHPVNSEGSEK